MEEYKRKFSVYLDVSAPEGLGVTHVRSGSVRPPLLLLQHRSDVCRCFPQPVASNSQLFPRADKKCTGRKDFSWPWICVRNSILHYILCGFFSFFSSEMLLVLAESEGARCCGLQLSSCQLGTTMKWFLLRCYVHLFLTVIHCRGYIEP